MKLRIKYLLFVVILHLVTLVLTYFIFQENKILFLVAEVFIIVSIIIAWNLYRQLIQPLKSLMAGLDAIRDHDFNVKFSPTGKYEVDQLIGVYNQMIDQLRSERTLQEQQHFFLEKLISTSPTGIIVLDYDNQIQQINPKALRIIAVNEQELINQTINTFSNSLLTQIADLKSGEAKTVKTISAATYKIQKSHFVDRGFSRHFIMIEELTAELLAAEKNVYGKVIRMMAHEVNNTIGPVNSIIQSTLKTPELFDDKNSMFSEALRVALDRNQKLNLFVRSFADLVKLPEPKKKLLELSSFIQSVCKLMQMQAKEKAIVLCIESDGNSFLILADEQQMEQALINIVKNSIEAIGFQGKITFKLDATVKQLTVIDTGTGITAQQNEQLFTPFFSTKKDGQGIGLTLIREIFTNHNFGFSLKTTNLGRTAFTISF